MDTILKTIELPLWVLILAGLLFIAAVTVPVVLWLRLRKALGRDLDYDRRSDTLICYKTMVRFCPKCFSLFPSNRIELYTSEFGWHCKQCNNFYQDKNWQPPAHSTKSCEKQSAP